MTLVENIVNACIELYKKLPITGKPGASEWTVISAVVAVFDNNSVKVLSLGTGSKCIGKNSLSPNGDVLNDSHAEVIARRAFLKYLFLQIIQLNVTDFSEVLFKSAQGNFCVKDSVKFYFVTSMSPCGDASIIPKTDSCVKDGGESFGMCLENIPVDAAQISLKRGHSSTEIIDSKKQKLENSNEKGTLEEKVNDIYRTGAKCLQESAIQDPHLPGPFYHNIGAVRTKPGRGDPTLSVSCSDKIARWNAVGWQGALLSLFISCPIFVEGIVCGGGTPFSKASIDRAVNERIARKNFTPVYQSDVVFPDIKAEGKKPSPSSIIWCNSDGNQTEISVNGRRLGVIKKNYNKRIARTSICKRELFVLFERAAKSLRCKNEILGQITNSSGQDSLENMTYGELKAKAVDYQNRWKAVKENYFKVWSNKPAHLLKFTLKDSGE